MCVGTLALAPTADFILDWGYNPEVVPVPVVSAVSIVSVVSIYYV